MVRTQIQLTDDQHRRLRRWAQTLGISLAEAVRRCVTEHLAADEAAPSRKDRIRAVLSLAGKYSDPDPHVAADHDRYLAEAYRH
jgi:hypothetical protein